MTLKLEVGKKYRNRKGEVVKIVENTVNALYEFKASNGILYLPHGAASIDTGNIIINDLIEEVIEPVEPERKAHKHAKFIKLFVDGVEVEGQFLDSIVWRSIKFLDEFDAGYLKEVRIKRPQWQQDLIDGAKAGKVVQRYSSFTNSWSHLLADDFDDCEFQLPKDHYRIKPEPKPDVELYLVKNNKVSFAWDELIHTPKTLEPFIKVVIDGTTGKLKSAEVL